MIAQPDRLVNARILLASASPRRRELITLLSLPFETTSADIDETPLDHELASDLAMRLSQAKAQQVYSHLHWNAWSAVQVSPTLQPSALIVILASDTIVSLDGKPLGKPRDAVEARSMLRRLRDRSHQVFTSITMIDTQHDQTITDLASTDVPMRNYSDEEIEMYITSGDPFDKAGAYAIQHHGFHPADRLTGCYANVMGLPLCHVTRTLQQLGVHPPINVPVACQTHIQYECPVFEKILMRDE
ncbi:MAG TPA: Maf family protein [Anaerolineae bacterium]|nr:Maf family protein [Anaerolineae bacterium]